MMEPPRFTPRRRLLAILAAAVLVAASGCATRSPQPAQAAGGPGVAPDLTTLPANHMPAPPYPHEALATGTSGRVVIKLLVAVDGTVKDAVIEESTPEGMFDAVTLESALDWTLRPPIREGIPVEGWMRVPVDFDIDDTNTVTHAKAIHAPPPRYPEKALANGVGGRVELLLTLDHAGSVQKVAVLGSTPPGVFDAAATEAVQGWKFSPLVVDGQPRGSQMRVPIDFDVPVHRGR